MKLKSSVKLSGREMKCRLEAEGEFEAEAQAAFGEE
jgi:hypothetical protein